MKKFFIWFLVVLLIWLPLSASFAQDIQPDIQVRRISGKNRYETSIAISQAGFSSSRFAVISSGTDYPDALAGGQLAGYLAAPLFITSPNGISDQLKAELQRLGVEKIYLLGGEAVLPPVIADALTPSYEVKRLAGRNRIETSKAIVEEIITLVGPKQNTYYAVSDDFPDALSASPLVVATDGVMNLNSRTKPVTSGIALGGAAIVPGTPTKRIAGSNRYETAVAVAKEYPVFSDSVIIVSGVDYPDALSAAGFSSMTNQPILLTNPNSLSKATADYLRQAKIKHVTIIGGEGPVSANVLNQIIQVNRPLYYVPSLPRNGLTVSPYPGYDIKGNISWNGEKIFHVPGQRDYAKTVIDESAGERWFKDEAEAKAAGWRKALR